MYKTRWEKERDSKNQHQNKTNLLQGEKKNLKNKIKIKLDEWIDLEQLWLRVGVHHNLFIA